MDSDLIVETRSGRVAGARLPAGGVRAWKGIPYAAAPVGLLRWRQPQPTAPWSGIRDALVYGPDFPQAPSPLLRAGCMAEDCLVLNVWSPAGATPGSLPVMVWFHGGGFVAGSGADARTEGENLAARGVVVVNFNYRSGLFGWLAHPRLSEEARAEGRGATSGNYGLLDQLAALAWVRENITGFGGDPAQVTAFGVSAGSASIALLLTVPEARGLFHRAILHSPGTGRPLATLAEAQTLAVSQLGADVEALRSLDAAALFALTPKMAPAVRGLTTPRALRPIHDGMLVREEERAALRAGRLMALPVIVGTNADEGSLLTRAWPVRTAADSRAMIATNFPNAVKEALAQYGTDDDLLALARVAEAFADTQFNAGARLLLRAMAAREPRCFGYRFTRRRPGRADGPHHGEEAAYVFGHLAAGKGSEPEPFDARDEAVAEAMATAWVAFAATGDPNVYNEPDGRSARPAGPTWPRYALGSERWLEFGDAAIEVVANPHEARLDFLDRYLG